MPIFYFGFVSKFSGTLIYDTLMYQAYNTLYTSLPVIWFATNDIEYPKETLLSVPELYKYGPRQLHLNIKVYIREIIYAYVEAGMVLYFSIVVITYYTPNFYGFFAGLVDAGDFVYSVCVIVANVKIVTASN